MPWITLGVVGCCVVLTMIVICWPDIYEKLAWSSPAEYFWQYVSGAFVHGDKTSATMAVAHLVANLAMFVPYGIMIEGLLGHKRFGIVFLASWLGISAVFQIIAWSVVPAGEVAYGAGLSGSSYAVLVMGVVALFQVFLLDKKKFWKQPLSYVFLSGAIGELFMLLPGVAGVLSMVIHLAGIGIGVVMTVVFHRDIRQAIG